MPRLLTALLLLHFSAFGQTPLPRLLLSEKGISSIATNRAGQLFHQCSREAPEASSQLWQPSKSQVAELEAALVPFMADRQKSGSRVPPTSVEYNRQYIGFTRNGEHLIYGNFYPATLDRSRALRAEPVVICDGGATFWGVVYRVRAKQFEEPKFNGEA